MEIKRQILAYNQRLERREASSIRLAVFHCTELPDMETARQVAEREIYPSGTGNCGHYYVDRDGSVFQYVELDRVAHHVVSYNRPSVGIEVVNTGRFPRWHHWANQAFTEPYAEAQYRACERLLFFLADRLPNLKELARHYDLDLGLVPATDRPDRYVRRKLDPGPRFDWRRMESVWAEIMNHRDGGQGRSGEWARNRSGK